MGWAVIWALKKGHSRSAYTLNEAFIGCTLWVVLWYPPHKQTTSLTDISWLLDMGKDAIEKFNQ